MKRISKILLSLTMMASLAACSSSTGSSATAATEGASGEQTVIKFAGLDGGYGTAGWEAVAAAFEKETGIKVELQMEKNIAETLRPVLTSGKDVPDVIYLSIGAEGKLTDTMVSEKQIQDISDVLTMTIPGETGTVKDKIIPGFTDALTSSPYQDGKLYLAPINYSPCGLFYDAGLFEEFNYQEFK